MNVIHFSDLFFDGQFSASFVHQNGRFLSLMSVCVIAV